MGFRHDGEREGVWRNWIARDDDMFITGGAADFVFSDEPTWFRFLEHGGWHHENGWRVEMLPSHEAAVFSDFIKSEYGVEEYRSVLRSLGDKRP